MKLLSLFLFVLLLQSPSTASAEEPRSSQKTHALESAWNESNKDPLAFLVMCYASYMDDHNNSLLEASGSREKYEFNMIMSNGFEGMLEHAITTCDPEIQRANIISNKDPSYKKAKIFMYDFAKNQNATFLKECSSDYCKKFSSRVTR